MAKYATNTKPQDLTQEQLQTLTPSQTAALMAGKVDEGLYFPQEPTADTIKEQVKTQTPPPTQDVSQETPQKSGKTYYGVTESFIVSNQNQAVADMMANGATEAQAKQTVKSIMNAAKQKKQGVTGDQMSGTYGGATQATGMPEGLSYEEQQYYQAMQAQNDLIAAQMEQANKAWDQFVGGQDKQMAQIANDIKKSYETRFTQMNQINKALAGNVQTAQFRTGRARYAPEMATGFISAEESAGQQRISSLTSEMNKEIMLAQEAAKDASRANLTALGNHMETIRSLQQQRTDAALSMLEMSKQKEKDAQEKAKFMLDMQQYENEIVRFEMENEAVYAGSVATGLVKFDDEFNMIPPSQTEIAAAAEEFGLDPNILSNAVFNQMQTIKGMKADEYGTYFEQQQFLAEQAQRDFNNLLDTQKFNLEMDMFGFKVTESGYDLIGGQLVKADTGEVGGVMDWAQQISEGKLKMSDVPADLKTVVVQALNSIPPKQADVADIEKKIAEIDEIAKMPGITKAVGVNWAARTNFNPFDWNDKAQKNAFIGKVEKILSQKTLDALISAKESGATFGALSEGELQILQASASEIGSWARDTDGDGVTDFYEVDEKTFKKSLQSWKEDYEKLAETAKKQIASTPYSGSADFTMRAPQSDKDKFIEYYNNPLFQGASSEDIIQAINEFNGFSGEKGGALLGFAIKNNFPAGEKGGQCGTFAHKLVQFPPVGDLKSQKFAAVDKFGIKKQDWSPKVGDVVITGEHPKWGHVAVVNKILPGGKLQLSESNYKSDEKITHNRILSYFSPTIYGAIRGSYNV